MYTDFTNPVTAAVVTIVYLTFKLVISHLCIFYPVHMVWGFPCIYFDQAISFVVMGIMI